MSPKKAVMLLGSGVIQSFVNTISNKIDCSRCKGRKVNVWPVVEIFTN
jgi:hypothetical protein